MGLLGHLKSLIPFWQGAARPPYELAPVGLASFSERTQSLTQCNPFFSELLGYGNCADCIEHFAVLYHLTDDESNQSALSELRETNRLLAKQLRVRSLTGDYRSVVCNLHREPISSGIEIAVFPMLTAETMLHSERIRNTQLQQVLLFSMQMLNSSTWEWDLVHQTIHHSDHRAHDLGYGNHDSSSDADYWFNLIAREDQQGVINAVSTHLKGGNELYESEFRIRDAENTEHWIKAWGKVIEWDRDGKAVRMIGISRDVTELKLSQQSNSRLQNQLYQARKMHTLGQLTGGFAHDFNNLLASIIGYTGLVLDKGRDILDTRFKNYLSEVYKAGQLGQKLVSQMLSFGRNGSTEMVPAMIGLLVKDAVQLVKPALSSSIELDVHIEEQIPSVETNAFKLSQILMNLCINGKDAMEGVGKLEIYLGSDHFENTSCFCCHAPVAGHFVQIRISDSGCGIAKEMLPHIFDPFFTTKQSGRGTGVGLSMVNSLMHEHNGHLLVKSTPNQGTTFTLLFPPSRQVSADSSPSHLGVSRYQPVHRGHILVVDDDQAVGNYIAEVLKHHGHRVTLESGSIAALNRYQDNPYVFDAVVTDQTMPGMTGSSLMQAMIAVRKDIPVIICTAYSENLDEESARLAGAQGYLRKPINVDQLIDLLDQSLSTNHPQQAGH